MATTKITDLTAYTDPVSTDVLPIVDVSGDLTKKVSIADLMENAGAGAEATPGIAFDGDPNTGIYSPGADQLAISTGGTQRLLIDDSGVVTVAGDLTVNGTTTTVNSTTVTVDDKNIELGSVGTPTDTTADGGGITLKGATDKTINWVNSTDSWTSSENVDLASGKTYKINGTDVLSATALGSAVQISSDNIPSGTIVNDDVNASAAIAGTKVDPDFGSQTVETTGVFSAAGGAQATPSITFTGDLNTGIYSPGADQVAISTAGSGRLFVDGSGRVGIGTLSPGALLELSGSSSSSELRLRSTDTTNATIRSYVNSLEAGKIAFTSGRELFIETAGSERLRFTSDGRLLVGTSSEILTGAEKVLQLRYPNGGPEIVLGRNDPSVIAGNIIGAIRFASNASGAVQEECASIEVEADDTHATGDKPGRLVFSTTAIGAASPTERMRIDSSGNVGIGTDAPEHTLDIRGDLKTEYLIATTAFSDNLTNVSVARLTGVLNPILTLPSTSGKKYVIHSIYASNIARVEQQTAGASATIATTGFDTEKNIGAADALRTEGVYTIPSDVWTTDGSGTEAVFIITVDGTGAATIAVDYAGIGFAVDDTITVPDANLGAGGAADLTFQVATLTGVVESVNLLVPGEGYVEPPTVYFDDGTTGTGSIITADVDSDGKLIRLNLINRGSGYVEDDGNLLRIDAPPLTATEIGISGSFVDSSTSVESYFAFDVPIPVGGALDILKQPQILNPNDIIKMQSYDADGSGLSDAADVFITYEEVDDTFYTGSVASLTTTANTTLLTAPSTNPLLVRSIRLTNTEFVGDYDVSIKVNDGSNTYYLVRNIIIPTFATVEICDTPRRIEANWSIEAELSVIGQDVNLASSIDIQVSAKKL